jgi:hypothetical protein
MNTLRMKIALGLAALAITAASLGIGADSDALARKVNEYEGQHIVKVNEYEGQHVASRKVNEYEGQH